MTEQAQNAAIAIWLGLPAERREMSPSGSFELVMNPANYARDLNAMASAENKLFEDERLRAEYEDALCAGNGVFASAPQRAESLLRTLGLWTEDEP